MNEAKRQAQYVTDFYKSGGVDYGHQWGSPTLFKFKKIVSWINKIPQDVNLLEIGPGGGRWTQLLLDSNPKHVQFLIGSEYEEQLTKDYTQYYGPSEWMICDDGKFDILTKIDYAFSFDVFVHFDAYLFNNYITSVGKCMNIGGKFLFNWGAMFQDNKNWSDGSGCFYYYNDELIKIICKAAGFGNYTIIDDFPNGFGSRAIEVTKISK